ncbi:protein kinase domain-containing protein [Limnobacter alexandrii]|uniref:protein kinase domain-containing protein n=1 Tax=Limnobacter alexandrii TaxID=2570352 RepID=UPI0011086BE1|nr:protein kinase [Limnobacter alexandrii]
MPKRVADSENMKLSQPELVGASIRIDGRTMQIPGYQLLRVVGHGANAVVFEALDEALSRKVAIKVWNGQGITRAQSEASKIAGLNHPLIVSTYTFGRIENHPFCVMEMIVGVSGKEWIKHNQSTEARLTVWSLYADALRYIHDLGGIHGDPHLGNLLVATNISGTKIADAGTSEFWADHSKIEAREAKLILQTASRLFAQESFDQLWRHPFCLGYRDTLTILQVVVKYLGIVYGLVDWDRRSDNADLLSDLVTQNPFFNLEVVFRQIKKTGITTEDRLARRINARLRRMHNILDAGDKVNKQTLELYEAAAAQALSLMAQGRGSMCSQINQSSMQ